MSWNYKTILSKLFVFSPTRCPWDITRTVTFLAGTPEWFHLPPSMMMMIVMMVVMVMRLFVDVDLLDDGHRHVDLLHVVVVHRVHVVRHVDDDVLAENTHN
jgi:uncharacterized membrane protein YhdT